MKKQLLMIVMLALVALQIQAQDDEGKKREKTNYGTHNHFDIDLGMNNFLQNGDFPDDNNAPYAVKPFGSWYVALKSVNDTHVTGALHLLWGPEVSWYNFKFNNEAIRLTKNNNQLEFNEAADNIDAQKSKLTVAYLNFSAVPMLKFGDQGQRHRHRHCWVDWDDFGRKEGFRIGVGGYGGYKIASYTKSVVVEDGDKKKDRDKDSFYLNNFRYGVRLQAGFRGVDIFANYDLNELFVEGKGPQLNAFSFGIVL
ncbi:hypothetical protein [Fulvivirga imtechensis]|nr:hypothetical protein [Fulvivirga imtechensis]